MFDLLVKLLGLQLIPSLDPILFLCDESDKPVFALQLAPLPALDITMSLTKRSVSAFSLSLSLSLASQMSSAFSTFEKSSVKLPGVLQAKDGVRLDGVPLFASESLI